MNMWRAYRMFRHWNNDRLESLAKAVLLCKGEKVLIHGKGFSSVVKGDGKDHFKGELFEEEDNKPVKPQDKLTMRNLSEGVGMLKAVGLWGQLWLWTS